MDGAVVADGLEDGPEAARELLRRGERCAVAGQVRQAEALLVRAWTLTAGRDPEPASAAAWGTAWLFARAGDYTAAAVWFRRVLAPPAAGSALWPAARQTLVELCQGLARAKGDAPQPRAARPAPPMTPRAPALPPLDIGSLGRFQILRDGRPLPASRARKATAILRYLLIQPHRSAHKDELADLFWPDSPPREAAHSLHVAVSALRRHLDPPAGAGAAGREPASYLLFADGHYRLRTDAPIAEDRERFLRLCEEGERAWGARDSERAWQVYGEAVAGYGGDYYLDEAAPDWALAERERLLSRYLTALDRLGRLAAARGLHEPAAECFRRLLERDGYREDAHAQLMRCYWQLGRRGEALRQYERCAALLERDLGLAPMPELQDLHRLIAGGAAPEPDRRDLGREKQAAP